MQNTNKIKKIQKPNYLLSLLNGKCARCRKGNMFNHKVSINVKTNMEMPQHCTECGQPMELEVGFYYGTGYVSYALTVAICVATFIAYWVLIGISIYDNSLFYYLGVNLLVLIASIPYLMRLSRTIWLSFFVRYNPDWNNTPPKEAERIVEEQMNNW